MEKKRELAYFHPSGGQEFILAKQKMYGGPAERPTKKGLVSCACAKFELTELCVEIN